MYKDSHLIKERGVVEEDRDTLESAYSIAYVISMRPIYELA